ncbi:MAG: NAD+ synthase [bacterium]
MRVALCRTNPTIGDLDANAAEILAQARAAADAGADLAVFPELALTGYPPKDLLLSPGFLHACQTAADRLIAAAPAALTIVFGAPVPVQPSAHPPHPAQGLFNALIAARGGATLAVYRKRLLPTYDVFDEDRYFIPGPGPVVISVPTAAGPPVRVGLSICEDLWRGEDVGFSQRYLDAPDPLAELVRPPADPAAGAQLIVNPSASPFVLGKSARHRALVQRHAATHRLPILAVNQLGGNDELIFDGAAFGFDAAGRPLAAAAPFTAQPQLVDVPLPGHPSPTASPAIDLPPAEDLLFAALVTGIRDYARKTGFRSAVLGLSGGIDSAVTAVLAAAALGPANVVGVAMPSRYSSPGSITDAHALAQRLACPYHLLPIDSAVTALEGITAPVFAGRPPDVTEENLQSRVRGTLLMALSNKFGHLLLTTGNKSELAVGYCTLYGDMNGGLAVLSDVTKHWVYRLANWLNANWAALGIPTLAAPPIPHDTITKPPSAELRPNQTDQDSLPPDPVLDELIERYVERHQPVPEILAEMAYDHAVLRRMIRLIDLAEYKRKQAPIGLKITGVAFGSGRRMPIAQRWRPEAR